MQQPLHLKCNVCGTEVDIMASDGIDLLGMARIEGWRFERVRRHGHSRHQSIDGDSPAENSVLWNCPACNDHSAAER